MSNHRVFIIASDILATIGTQAFCNASSQQLERAVTSLGYSPAIVDDVDGLEATAHWIRKASSIENATKIPLIISGVPCPLSPDKQALMEEIADTIIYTRHPTMGICYGAQLLARRIYPDAHKLKIAPEFGAIALSDVVSGNALNIYHGVSYASCHRDATIYDTTHAMLEPLAITQIDDNHTIYEAYKVTGAPIYGTQFHPELNESSFNDLRKSFEASAGSAISLTGSDIIEPHWEVIRGFLDVSLRDNQFSNR